MESGHPNLLPGMSMDEVRSLLGDPDRTHLLTLGQDLLTSWIYHTEPEPMCLWFDSGDRLCLLSSNCVVKPAVAS